MAELKKYAAEPMTEVPEMEELIDKKIKEMAELKPCPFCGCKKTYTFPDIDSEFGMTWAVVCDECGATGPFEDSIAQAIDAWNKRSGK